MNTNLRAWRLGALSLLPLISACSWDFTKLPPAQFRKTMCDAVDNFQKNAQANAAAITDPVRRDQAYQQLNLQLQQLTTEKLNAINAYLNCNEARLKAAQATAKNIIDAITRIVGGNMANPLEQVSYNVRGHKPPGTGPQQMIVQSGDAVLVAGPTPTDPLQVSGFVLCDFQPTSQGYGGPVLDVQWQVGLPGIATWNVTLTQDPSNTFTLVQQGTAGFVGHMHLNLLVDGRGITWPLVADLPLSMDVTETQWSSTSGGMRPADLFFPPAPVANIRYGHGCAGGLAVEPELNPFGVSRVGDPLILRVDEAPPAGLSTLVLGFAPTQLDLSPFFGLGCDLFVTPDLLMMQPIDPMGTAVHTLPIPPDPVLAGLTLHFQSVVVTPSSSGIVGGLTMPVKQTLDAR
ncbi:MAG: hypothetical protein R3F56_13955 [Planctomycetota bacterium]